MAVAARREALTKDSLASALGRVECASVIVCGWRAALAARRVLSRGGFELKVAENRTADADPDEWELF